MKKQNGNEKKWIFGILMTIAATIVVLACGHSQIDGIGDDGGAQKVCGTNADGTYATAGTACTFTTYTPAINKCYFVTNETGYDCSRSTNSTHISVQKEKDGQCDGYGACSMGSPDGDPTTMDTNLWMYTQCGG